VTVYNAPAESKPVAPPSKPKAAAAGAALMTLLSQLPTLPMQLGQPEADAPTLNLLYVALEAPVQYDPKDVETLIKPLLLAAQRCASQQLTMRLAYLLVSVVRLLHRRARLVLSARPPSRSLRRTVGTQVCVSLLLTQLLAKPASKLLDAWRAETAKLRKTCKSSLSLKAVPLGSSLVELYLTHVRARFPAAWLIDPSAGADNTVPRRAGGNHAPASPRLQQEGGGGGGGEGGGGCGAGAALRQLRHAGGGAEAGGGRGPGHGAADAHARVPRAAAAAELVHPRRRVGGAAAAARRALPPQHVARGLAG
jgi:uncharacterized membrane protein YgcG